MLPKRSRGLNFLLDLRILIIPFRLLLPAPILPSFLISSSDLFGSSVTEEFFSVTFGNHFIYVHV